MIEKPIVHCIDLGRIPFAEAWKVQEKYFNELIDRKKRNRNLPLEEQEKREHYLLFCEHPHVYTLGRSGKQEHLLINEKQLAEKGIEFYPINRGGDITYHGPGQIVGYPILDLDEFTTDIHEYLRRLEEVIIRTLGEYGLSGERSKGETGVWFDTETPSARKVCAMGIKASRWVTMHGWALNHQVDLSYFNYIVPCGISDKAVASMHHELESTPSREEVQNHLVSAFQDVFNCNCQWQKNSSKGHSSSPLSSAES